MNRSGFVIASWLLVALVAAAALGFGVEGAVAAAIPAAVLVVGGGMALVVSSMRSGRELRAAPGKKRVALRGATPAALERRAVEPGAEASAAPVSATYPRAHAERAPVEPTPLLAAEGGAALVDDDPRSNKISRILIGAVALHMFAALAINITDLNKAVAPDTYANRFCGVFLARSWADPSYDAIWSDMDTQRPELCVSYKRLSLAQKLNGVVEYMVGNERFTHVSMGMLNGLVGVLAAYVMAQVARRLYGNYAEERTLIYIAFFPSLVVWRSINLRESWSFLLLSAAIYTGIQLRERFSMRNLAYFALCIGCMPFVRAYIMALFAIGTLVSYVAVRVRQVPVAIVMTALLFGVIQAMATRFGLAPEEMSLQNSLARVNELHQGLAGGGSSFGTDDDLTTPTGALSYLPKGVALFLFSPFPWTISSWRQIAAIPESMFWYVLLYRAIKQIGRSLRDDLSRIALPLSVAVVMTLAYGLVEANGGTAYRHRAHVVLIGMMFAGGEAAHRRRLRQRAAMMIPRPNILRRASVEA